MITASGWQWPHPGANEDSAGRVTRERPGQEQLLPPQLDLELEQELLEHELLEQPVLQP